MKKFFLLACVAATMISCADDSFLGNDVTQTQDPNEYSPIFFKSNELHMSRASYGADAAKTLGNNFIVYGVKGNEVDSDTDYKMENGQKVFDNYLVAYDESTMDKATDNTDGWKYVGDMVTPHVAADPLKALHGITSGEDFTQSIKYWDFSADNYKFVAFSAGERNIITDGDPVADTSVKMTRIAPNAPTSPTDVRFTVEGKSAADFGQCYVTTNAIKVDKSAYKQPVNLKFQSLGALLRVGFYETVPGYKVTDIKFYEAKEPSSAGTTTYFDPGLSQPNAHLYVNSDTEKIYNAGTFTVQYINNKLKSTFAGSGEQATLSKLNFNTLTYPIGETLAKATFAKGSVDNNYIPMVPGEATDGLTLRVNYTLESEDGSGETITVYGAKAVVPANYTKWDSNYAYTYIFKISDKSNGWTDKGSATSTTTPDNDGLYPITFDAVVENVKDNNQTTVTTVATPSITTYQPDHKAGAEYAKNAIYVKVGNTSNNTFYDLTASGKLQVYTVSADATEGSVMSALLMRSSSSPIVGRNGLTLTALDDAKITHPTTLLGQTLTSDEQKLVAQIDASDVTSSLAIVYQYEGTDNTGTKVFVPAQKPADTKVKGLYKLTTSDLGAAVADSDNKADAEHIYFAKKVDGTTTTYTYVHEEVGVDVTGLVALEISTLDTKLVSSDSETWNDDNIYLDIYTQFDNKYAVKVVKF